MGRRGPSRPTQSDTTAAHDRSARPRDGRGISQNNLVSRRVFLKRSLAVTATASLGISALTACAGSTLASPPQLKADTIYHNGIVLTMVAGQLPAQALAIKGDKIIAVGSNASVLALTSAATKVVDLAGRTLLPGFNDSHCHRIGDRAAAGFATAQEAIAATLSQGWTSISELFVNQQRLDELHSLDGTGQLRLRVNAYLPVNYLADKYGMWFNGSYQPRQELGPRLRVAGAKIFADRGDPRKNYLSQPHSDNLTYFGDVYWTQAELSAIVQQLHNAGWQIATHTCGDAAHDMVLNAYEAALGNVSNTIHRHRIEHCMILRDDQVLRMLLHKIIASIQVNWFQSDWTQEVDETLGPGRVNWAGRWKDVLAAGIPAIGGTDAPWAVRDELNGTPGPALKALYQAVSRIGEGGTAPTAWMLAQRLTIEQSLGLITRDAAYGTFDEGIKGTLVPGKLADLVVLSANPLTVLPGDPEQLLQINVLLTMIGGKAEYTRPGSEDLDP
jgi:predicted amidohydrolase YtcJ